ncbi:MAG: ATP-grasp domain-containing protein [Peptoniphilaceae bacterium]|uniref:ATP-grasp domain-containing protein n=1 Tax=Parvimonas sp. TaxID=1944660 RepID=UPI002A75703A|nr:ATP-grasp domain-containing protein [Parvimonas sp.]MDD7764878.1 ATP-grasp domain-containing protein [Peptoniphilaceae bacterium]MDY3050114.1 ATP-grasp domain-containing protein [Parvimonas sp.]
MKKLLLLGGSSYLIPAIKSAQDLGVYVITCDYLPDNIAHKYSDEYHNVSIVDKEAVLKLAKELKVDGVMSFATDPGVVVASYVATELGLPTSPYKSIEILQNKGKFRKFLEENNFNVPKSETYKTYDEAVKNIEKFEFPIIVKPVDSAGSKGVTRVDDLKTFKSAFEYALKYSVSGEVIVEEFIEKSGFSTDTDSFSVDGELVFCSFNNQWFDEKADNPYTPSAYTWPSTMDIKMQNELESELQRLIKLLNMKSSIYNIETRIGKNGKSYIMECTPRAGGNRLAEILKLATGQDIITASVKASLGMEIDRLTKPKYNGFWGELILHSNESGVFQELIINENVKDSIVEVDLWISKGDFVKSFTGANETVGTVIINCKTKEELERIIKNSQELIKVSVK